MPRRSKWDSVLLEDPVPGNVVQALDELGVEIIRVDGDEALGRCPAHIRRTGKQDRHPSWSVNTETGSHNCFSCGFKGPFFVIVKEILQVGDEDAIAWVKSKGSIDRAFANVLGLGLFENDEPEVYTNADLALFIDVPKNICRRRGLKPWACDDYGVLWDTEEERWILPVREWRSNRLMGWQEKGEYDRYFRNQPKNMEKGRTLFGINQHEGTVAVMVESPLDTVAIYGVLETPIALASYGARITDEQLDLLQDLGVRNVVSALDNDRAGDAANRELIHRCRGRFKLSFWDYGDSDAKDPGDQSPEEIHDSFANAYPSSEWVPSWL